MKKHLIALAILSSIVTGAPQQESSKKQSAKEIDQQVVQEYDARNIKDQLRRNSDAISEIRQGQLNYKIERDILEKMYSASFSRLNTTITLILGVFAFLGGLGLWSIKGTRDKFSKELLEMTDIRGRFEANLAELREEQDEVNAQIDEVKKDTDSNDQRLQLLEIQEKAGRFISESNYDRAMKYINVGLEINPQNRLLILQKALCMSSMSKFVESRHCYGQLLEIDATDMSAASNLFELHLLNRDIASADQLIANDAYNFAEYKSEYLLWYFEVLKKYVTEDLEGLEKLVQEMPDGQDEKIERIPGWQYLETRLAFANDDESTLRRILWSILSFLEGTSSKTELVEKIQEFTAEH